MMPSSSMMAQLAIAFRVSASSADASPSPPFRHKSGPSERPATGPSRPSRVRCRRCQTSDSASQRGICWRRWPPAASLAATCRRRSCRLPGRRRLRFLLGPSSASRTRAMCACARGAGKDSPMSLQLRQSSPRSWRRSLSRSSGLSKDCTVGILSPAMATAAVLSAGAGRAPGLSKRKDGAQRPRGCRRMADTSRPTSPAADWSRRMIRRSKRPLLGSCWPRFSAARNCNRRSRVSHRARAVAALGS